MKKIMINFLTVVLALVLVLAGYEWYNRRRIKTYLSAAQITSGLQVANSVKVQMANFHEEYGRYPASNQELGLPESHQFASPSLSALEVSPNGVITLRFENRQGIQDGIIQLIPGDENTSLITRWRCVTPSYASIASWAPQCEYQPE